MRWPFDAVSFLSKINAVRKHAVPHTVEKHAVALYAEGQCGEK